LLCCADRDPVTALLPHLQLLAYLLDLAFWNERVSAEMRQWGL
jgi:hypothetical protein